MRLAILLTLLTGAPLTAQEYFPPPDSAGGWRTLSDAAQIRKTAGMDKQKLDWAFEYASRTSQHGGLLVAGTDTWCTKGITARGIGKRCRRWRR